MKKCIIYVSKHGSTETTAKMLKEKLDDDCDLINLNEIKKIDLSDYDTIVLGAPMYLGKLHKKMKKCIENDLDELLKKHIGLFIMGADTEKPEENIQKAYPQKLHDHAFSREYFGYAMILENMNFLEKAAMKALKIKESKTEIKEEAIQRMADKVNKL